MPGGGGAALPSLSGRHFVCRFAAVCSSVPRLFPQDVWALYQDGAYVEYMPPDSRKDCASMVHCSLLGAVSRVLTVTIFYAIVKPGGVPDEHHCDYRIEYSHDMRAMGSIVNFNTHQGYPGCNGADGTSRFAERISESPGLVKPDDAGAPKINPEPPPNSPLLRMSRRGRNPSVITRGDMHTCPTKRIVVCAHNI